MRTALLDLLTLALSSETCVVVVAVGLAAGCCLAADACWRARARASLPPPPPRNRRRVTSGVYTVATARPGDEVA